MQGSLGNILLELISHQEWVWRQCSHFMVTVWCKYCTIIYLYLAINIPTLYLRVFVTIIFLLFTIHFLISIEIILGCTCSAFHCTKLLVRTYILPLKLEYHWRNGSYWLDPPPKSPVYNKDDLMSIFNGQIYWQTKSLFQLNMETVWSCSVPQICIRILEVLSKDFIYSRHYFSVNHLLTESFYVILMANIEIGNTLTTSSTFRGEISLFATSFTTTWPSLACTSLINQETQDEAHGTANLEISLSLITSMTR